jgi:hypothetical protein
MYLALFHMHLPRLTIVFTVLLTPTSLFAQNKSLSQQGDSLYAAKNYALAGQVYNKAATVEDFKAAKSSMYYNAACCYALSGSADSAMVLLKSAVTSGYKNTAHLKEDTDLKILHDRTDWQTLVKSSVQKPASTKNPMLAKLITSDVKNYWKAYDMAQKDTANRQNIYRKYYVDAGTAGLQDYFAFKVKSMKNFVRGHDRRPKFYAAIRKNTYTVDTQKPQMLASFVKFKNLYPEANFPNVYFIIGSFSSGGTSTDNGLLIGLDQTVRTPDIPTGELTLWQRNNFNDLKTLPNLVAHELIHFNQDGLANDTTLLRSVLIEGMADFIAELISGKTPNDRLHLWAKGKEKQIWSDFRKEMYLDRYSNWIANSDQETESKPADLGYWVGYQICKAYYDQTADKKQAVHDILNIKDYKAFYENSKVDSLY